MKKRLPIILAFVLLVLSLSNSACSLTKPADEIYNSFSPTAEVFAEETAISRFVQMGDKSLTIDAVLSPVDLNKMPEIRLSFDKNTLTKMVNDIVLVKYPQVTESIMDGNSLWSILRDDGSVELSFSCSPEGLFSGLVFYVDAERDVTGENLDPDGSIWIPHYITQLKPDDISFSAKEAGNRICSLLSGYSCFDYAPRSIVAQYDRQLGKGCYHLWLQPFFEGAPVYGNGISWVWAFMSQEDLFQFQGTMVLMENSRRTLEHYYSLGDALNTFEASLPAYAYGNEITCKSISVGYIADRDPANPQSDIVTLSPAWIFECTDVKSGPEHGEKTMYYYCYVLLETGEFWSQTY